MLFVSPLTAEEIQTLEAMHKNHPCYSSRIRAHAVLLSHAGFKLAKIAAIYGVCRQSVSTWLHAWEKNGICALVDSPRSGRPRLLTGEVEREALRHLDQSPRSLKKVLAELFKNRGLTPSLSTLKRLCHRAGRVWKRVRKSLRSKRDPDLFEQSQQHLSDLIEQAKHGHLDLFYFDEAGFTLTPCIPYAWQPRGETLEVPCAASQRLNVLGFINRQCAFTSLVFEGTVTSATVVASIDHFSLTLRRPTTLIMDNASVHKSTEFQGNIDRWRQQGLTILNIAPYSPELNIIEILWRKIKYEWLPFSAYESFQNMKDSLFEILANIGKSYTIEFA